MKKQSIIAVCSTFLLCVGVILVLGVCGGMDTNTMSLNNGVINAFLGILCLGLSLFLKIKKSKDW